MVSTSPSRTRHRQTALQAGIGLGLAGTGARPRPARRRPPPRAHRCGRHRPAAACTTYAMIDAAIVAVRATPGRHRMTHRDPHVADASSDAAAGRDGERPERPAAQRASAAPRRCSAWASGCRGSSRSSCGASTLPAALLEAVLEAQQAAQPLGARAPAAVHRQSHARASIREPIERTLGGAAVRAAGAGMLNCRDEALVGIIMGSSSDWETMSAAADTPRQARHRPRDARGLGPSHPRPAVRICRQRGRRAASRC